MAYYVYENWTAKDRAVIHSGECNHCNNGKGCHENPARNQHGKWHGTDNPFRTYKDAKTFAESLGRKIVKDRCVKLSEV